MPKAERDLADGIPPRYSRIRVGLHDNSSNRQAILNTLQRYAGDVNLEDGHPRSKYINVLVYADSEKCQVELAGEILQHLRTRFPQIAVEFNS